MDQQRFDRRASIGLLLVASIALQVFPFDIARVAYPQDSPAPQQGKREEPDLQVLTFMWVREEQPKSRVIRGAQRPGGLIVNPVNTSPDLGSRKGELRTIDKKAAASAEKPREPYYQLRLELKNTGATLVRGLIWEFQPTAVPDDYQPRRYLCALEVKPNEKKILDFWTPFIPVRVISAKTIDVLKEGSVVIDQIHYTDGPVWTKPGWNYKLPADSLKKLAEGTCSWF